MIKGIFNAQARENITEGKYMIHYTQFVNMARKIATQYKTLYVSGCFGNRRHDLAGGIT